MLTRPFFPFLSLPFLAFFSTSQLFDTEAKRKIRKEPATALELSQVPEADGLDELWTIA